MNGVHITAAALLLLGAIQDKDAQSKAADFYRKFPEDAGWTATRYAELARALILTGQESPKYLDRRFPIVPKDSMAFAPARQEEVLFYDNFELWAAGRDIVVRGKIPAKIPAFAPDLPAVELSGDPFGDFFRSLSAAQKKVCLKPADESGRSADSFQFGKRASLTVRDLGESQIDLLSRILKDVLSERAYAKAVPQGVRSGLRGCTLTFFGEPGKDPAWSFKISDYYFSIVHSDSDAARFGPVVLGAESSGVWEEQEATANACFARLSEDEKKKCVVEGRGLSSSKLGFPLAELSEDARKGATAMLDERIRLFGAKQQEKLRKIIEGLGGVEKLRIAFFGPVKGKIDWKIEGPGFLCDYESRGRVRMTIRAGK